jgi:predicted RNase H-like HicB family nuclease
MSPLTEAGMSNVYRYTIVIRPDDDTFVAYVPAIPGCHAVGRTPAEAQAELVHVFTMIEEEFAHEGRPLPPDVPTLIACAG